MMAGSRTRSSRDEGRGGTPDVARPSREEAEAAVRTLLAWIGEDPSRRGLKRTPARFLGAYEDWFAGYRTDPRELLGSSFQEVDRPRQMVSLTNVDFESHCEHHVAPVIGRAHIAYLPDRRLAGISKLVRVVEALTRRLIVQERLTSELAACIQDVLAPRGVAVVVVAQHQCLTTRGVHRDNVQMTTSEMLGAFDEDERLRNEFLSLIDRGGR